MARLLQELGHASKASRGLVRAPSTSDAQLHTRGFFHIDILADPVLPIKGPMTILLRSYACICAGSKGLLLLKSVGLHSLSARCIATQELYVQLIIPH